MKSLQDTIREPYVRRHYIMILLLPVCLTLAGNRLQAQGEFLDRGQSGFGLDVLGLAGNGDAGLATGAGYSIGGMLDIGLSLGITWLNEEEWGPSAESRGWGPGIAYHAIRQSDIFPFSVAGFASYMKYKYSGAYYVLSGWPIKSENVSLGLAVYYRYSTGSRLTIVPMAEFVYTRVNLTVRQSRGMTGTEFDTYTGMAFSLPFSIAITKRHRLNLGTVITVSEHIVYWGLGLGYVMGHPSPIPGRKH